MATLPAAPAARLRDLTAARFQEIYKADRFTAAVLSSRMRNVVRRMCSNLLNNAFSQILRDWHDFAATISGPPEMNDPMSTVWLSEAEHWSMPLHVKSTTGFGVYGGRDGSSQANWMFPVEAFDVARERDVLPTTPSIYARSVPIGGVLAPETKTIDPQNGKYFYFASTPVWRTRRGAIFRYQTAGGGWGNPYERDPERVKRDVRDEYVTIEGAHRDYGVVITGDPVNDPEELVVDLEATRRRRAELSRERAQ